MISRRKLFEARSSTRERQCSGGEAICPHGWHSALRTPTSSLLCSVLFCFVLLFLYSAFLLPLCPGDNCHQGPILTSSWVGPAVCSSGQSREKRWDWKQFVQKEEIPQCASENPFCTQPPPPPNFSSATLFTYMTKAFNSTPFSPKASTPFHARQALSYSLPILAFPHLIFL